MTFIRTFLRICSKHTIRWIAQLLRITTVMLIKLWLRVMLIELVTTLKDCQRIRSIHQFWPMFKTVVGVIAIVDQQRTRKRLVLTLNYQIKVWQVSKVSSQTLYLKVESTLKTSSAMKKKLSNKKLYWSKSLECQA